MAFTVGEAAACLVLVLGPLTASVAHLRGHVSVLQLVLATLVAIAAAVGCAAAFTNGYDT